MFGSQVWTIEGCLGKMHMLKSTSQGIEEIESRDLLMCYPPFSSIQGIGGLSGRERGLKYQ